MVTLQETVVSEKKTVGCERNVQKKHTSSRIPTFPDRQNVKDFSEDLFHLENIHILKIKGSMKMFQCKDITTNTIHK